MESLPLGVVKALGDLARIPGSGSEDCEMLTTDSEIRHFSQGPSSMGAWPSRAFGVTGDRDPRMYVQGYDSGVWPGALKR